MVGKGFLLISQTLLGYVYAPMGIILLLGEGRPPIQNFHSLGKNGRRAQSVGECALCAVLKLQKRELLPAEWVRAILQLSEVQMSRVVHGSPWGLYKAFAMSLNLLHRWCVCGCSLSTVRADGPWLKVAIPMFWWVVEASWSKKQGGW